MGTWKSWRLQSEANNHMKFASPPCLYNLAPPNEKWNITFLSISVLTQQKRSHCFLVWLSINHGCIMSTLHGCVPGYPLVLAHMLTCTPFSIIYKSSYCLFRFNITLQPALYSTFGLLPFTPSNTLVWFCTLALVKHWAKSMWTPLKHMESPHGIHTYIYNVL